MQFFNFGWGHRSYVPKKSESQRTNNADATLLNYINNTSIMLASFACFFSVSHYKKAKYSRPSIYHNHHDREFGAYHESKRTRIG